VHKTKESKGTGAGNRLDLFDALIKMLPGEAERTAVISLALDLLPYYTPKPAVETYDFESGVHDEYLKAIKTDFVWIVLAGYVEGMQCSLKPELARTLKSMAAEFNKSESVLEIAEDPAFTAVKSALTRFRPAGMLPLDAGIIAKRLEPVILVEYARSVSEQFQVLLGSLLF
jgi:hypothetical protein